MTRAEAIKKLEEVSSKGLHSCIIIYYSPLSEIVEERHIYADSLCEILNWAEGLSETYDNSSIPAYIIYIDNEMRFSKGQLGDYLND